MNLHELPSFERPREKLFSLGAKALSNAELLAILISSGTKEESALVLAARVLSLEQNSLFNLSDYEPEELMKIKGIGKAKASQIVAALELGRRISSAAPNSKIPIEEPSDMAKLFMQEMRILKKEFVRIAMLDIKNCLIGKYDISIGGISSSSASPREVFAPAIKKGAAAVILVHNHPSGNPKPSDEDLKLTELIVKSGKILNIAVMDHIIIGDNCYCSLRSEYKFLF